MDLLLSIPVLTYFWAPYPPSWSTSLNILLFTISWGTLVMSHDPIKVHLVGVAAIRLVFWLAPSLLFLLFDVGLPSIAESVKHGGRAGLPPRNCRVLTRLLLLALFNAAFLLAVEGACSYAHTVLVGKPEFVTTTTLPFPWQMAKHIAVAFIGREALQYYIHRFLLHGTSSSSVAHLHASYAHSRRSAPFSLQVLTDHPLPLLLHRFLPLYVPAVLLRAHLLTYFLFAALCTLEETLSMSGYTIVPGIVMRGLGQRCAIHYASGGGANFGAYGVADWAHGTSRGRGVLEDLQAEAEKHQLQERAGEKVGEGASMVQGGLDALRGKKGKRKTAKEM